MSWLKVVGIGPGKVDYLTIRAYRVLTDSEIIVGYKRYLDLIKDEFSSKELVGSDMGDEKERVKKAIKFYLSGKKVAIVSGGDAGLYGIASVAIEEMQNTAIDFEKAQFEIVPGVTSATAVSNLVGCVVTQDFATISLSDYLVPWKEIEKRLENFSKLDITLAIYNPISSKRINNFEKAIEVLKKHKTPETLVVICENAYREGEKIIITNIGDFDKETVNMNCIIIVCPSNTKLVYTNNKTYVLVPRYYNKVL